MKLAAPFSLSLSLSLAACAGGEPAADLEAGVRAMSRSLSTCAATRVEPGVFSTDADEGRLVFSLDGRHAYFHRAVESGVRIFESHLRGGDWSPPVPTSFSSGYDELDPHLTPDGRTLYYSSFRPVPGAAAPRGDADIWKVERTGAGWSAPIHVAEVNTASMELFPSTTADGTLYFNSDRPGGVGAWDLYTARRGRGGFQAPQLLRGAVNTGIWEYNPSPSPGGTLLTFGSLDPDPAAPYSDLFFSVRLGGAYSARVNAGPCVNTEQEEYHPTLDLARGRLIFVRRDPFVPGGHGDFYEVKLPDLLLHD